MNLIKAAEDTKFNCFKGRDKGIKDQFGSHILHALWMLEQIISGEITGDKGQRWIGYAQGLLVSSHQATLAELKEINRQ